MQNTILIIVPTLNSYKILPNLVNSLKNQSSKSWRLLLIDGESCEEHKQYLNKLKTENLNISFIEQKDNSGIYGAMNLGLNLRKLNEWILFWGSDDLAYNEFLIEDLVQTINNMAFMDLDLIFNDAIYINKYGKKERKCSFKILKNSLKLSLFLGYSPPHQGCLFSPKVFNKIKEYSINYFLAADLDYFLNLSFVKNIKVKNLKKIIVKMNKGGISGKMFIKRFREVIVIYAKFFGILFFVPFISRYIIRIRQFIGKL